MIHNIAVEKAFFGGSQMSYFVPSESIPLKLYVQTQILDVSDDGSTDGSRAVLEAFAKTDNRVIVLSKRCELWCRRSPEPGN